MEARDQVRAAVDLFGEKLDALEGTVRPVLAALEDARAGAPGEDLAPGVRARVDATLAYALNAAFCMYLRTLGHDPRAHPVMDELARVRDAYIRIHAADAAKPDRPRKRSHAAVFEATKRLAAVLTDGERALHKAVSGSTDLHGGDGQRKVFDLSSDDDTAADAKPKPHTNTAARKVGAADSATETISRQNVDLNADSEHAEAKTPKPKSAEHRSERKSSKKKRKRRESDVSQDALVQADAANQSTPKDSSGKRSKKKRDSSKKKHKDSSDKKRCASS